ncbi:MAG: transcriptional regulator [Henriciella sp.]|jgi:transcriptional regulator|uniref:FMN-binding negative transcriptional regulator n=1 Tax=Henriciella sp. TaxID=1968823 RepID=UPI000C11BCEE|nr:FMN-binding negative transcriptional regulator [Henriciella sp.]MBF32604.1 transcriptional regulator [Hyphomonadaceae bacterium]MBK75912.1 transcriptional regulator [Henriciella sp.]PHR79564.1 MAG: transcriptional regulator [Henriciella sp.]|tara:strand:+ start:1269 stop:1874 length:606 start_codon:yes stop_codon:yes gene_type:complete
MHPAPIFLETDQALLLERVGDWPFALVVAVHEGRPRAVHTPVLAGADGSLRFHLAKSNPAARGITESRHALIVFSGPHDYISPDWYGIDNQVPTWNYLSVEAEGPVSLGDHKAAEAFLGDLSGHFERGLAPKPAWTMEKMDRAALDRMIAAIQTFTLTPERFEGITKISQNKPEDVRQRAGQALKAANGDPTLASMMERQT